MCASAMLRSRDMLLDRRMTFETPVLPVMYEGAAEDDKHAIAPASDTDD